MEKSIGFNLLTTIELKCLRGVAEAKLELEIAGECELSPAEVSSIISKAVIKLNCPNRVAAIAKAARLGLLRFDEK